MHLKALVYFVLIILVHKKMNKTTWCLAEPLPYTYPASIRVNNKLACNGAVITRTWILTICDCVKNNKPGQITVRVGMLSNEGQILKAKEIICEPQFVSDDKTPDKNLAFLKMPRIQFAKSIRQVALPVTGGNVKSLKFAPRPVIGTSFSINGWMQDPKYYTIKTDYPVRTWGYVSKIVSPDKCTSLKLSPTARTAVKAHMFCGGFFHRDATDCSMDKGTLMLRGAMIWGLLNYRNLKCSSSIQYMPYIDITAKTNMDFILKTVQSK